MPYITPKLLPLPDQPIILPTHLCGRCDKIYEYEYALRSHLRTDHLNPDTEMSNFTNFEYLGCKKNKKKPTPVVGQVKEVFVKHTKLKTVFMNINSIVSPIKRSTTKLGTGGPRIS